MNKQHDSHVQAWANHIPCFMDEYEQEIAREYAEKKAFDDFRKRNRLLFPTDPLFWVRFLGEE